MTRLTKAILLEAVNDLSQQDEDLKKITERLGPPPLWSRKTGFSSLVMIILEQQVSLASAHAVFKRLQQLTGSLDAAKVGNLTAAQLRSCGISRQKAAYIGGLAQSIMNEEIVLTAIHRADDNRARRELMKVRGIGPWTADIYLMMAMRRPDIWPRGDLALAESIRTVKSLDARPDIEQQLQLAKSWHPWRSVAARLFWHSYLSTASR